MYPPHRTNHPPSSCPIIAPNPYDLSTLSFTGTPPEPPRRFPVASRKERAHGRDASDGDAGVHFDNVPFREVGEHVGGVCGVVEVGGVGDFDDGRGGGEDADGEEEGEAEFAPEGELDVPD